LNIPGEDAVEELLGGFRDFGYSRRVRSALQRFAEFPSFVQTLPYT
jgi:hypothetical protein